MNSLLAKILGFVLFVAAIYFLGFFAGEKVVQKKWDASVARGKAIVEELKQKREIVTVKTEVKYVDRVKEIKVKGDEITKYVTVYVPDVDIDGSFRVLHDAAVDNTIPDPSRFADEAPTTLREVTATVTRNYEKCHIAYATVEQWQDWARQQLAINNEKVNGGQ